MSIARPRWTSLTVSAVLVVVAGCGSSAGSDETGGTDNPAGVRISGVESGRFKGGSLSEPYAMPDVTFTDTDDDPYNLVSDTASDITLVFFGYTNCPDVCQLVMADLTTTYLRLPDDVRDRTQVVYVTTDPARDTPAVLDAYLARFDPRFVGLSGSLADVRKAASAMGVFVGGMKKLPGGGYEVAHGAQVVGFRGLDAPVVWTENTPVDDIVSDVELLAGEEVEK